MSDVLIIKKYVLVEIETNKMVKFEKAYLGLNEAYDNLPYSLTSNVNEASSFTSYDRSQLFSISLKNEQDRSNQGYSPKKGIETEIRSYTTELIKVEPI